jgi:hypothetical protein
MPDDHTPESTPAIGHNKGPAFRPEKVEEHSTKAAEFLDAAGEWLAIEEITSEEQAGNLSDFVAGIRQRWKATDEDRKADKKPHDDAGTEVQGAYKPILDKMKRAAERVAPLQNAWLEKQEAIRQEEARKKADEARRQKEEADRLAAQAASRNDVSGEVDAEAAMKEAEKAEKAAARFAKGKAQTRSASGGGKTTSLRSYPEAEIENLRVALIEFSDHPEVADLLRTLATRRARAKGFDPAVDKIPGFTVKIVKRAV